MKVKEDKIEMICHRTDGIEYEYNLYKNEYNILSPLRIFPCNPIFNREEMQKLINLINTDFKITIERKK